MSEDDADWAKIEEEGKRIDEILHDLERSQEQESQRRYEERCVKDFLTALRILSSSGNFKIGRDILE